jgi:1-acyl-sn-glycerol-3-phosphate acyltransferase
VGILRLCLRLILLVLCLVSMGITLYFAPLGVLWVRRPGSLGKKLICFRASIMQVHLKVFGWVAGLRIERNGVELPKKQPFLLLSNHISYLDIIAIGSLWPVGFIAKEEIRSWFFLGGLAQRSNAIFVGRQSVEKRVVALRELMRVLEYLPFCVFPEGTTTALDTPTQDQWFRGNIVVGKRPGVPIYAVGLHYRNQKAQAWIDDDGLLPHLCRALQQPTIDLSVYVCPLSVRDGARPLSSMVLEAYQETVRACHQARQRAPWTLYNTRIQDFADDSALT